MHAPEAGVEEPRASQSEQQAAGGDEVPIEDLQERSERRQEQQADHEAAAERLLEGHRRGEPLLRQPLPGAQVGDQGGDGRVEQDPDHERQQDGPLEPPAAEPGRRFFGALRDRLEAGHEIRDDLQDQKHREDGAVAEGGLEIPERPPARRGGREDDEQGEQDERHPHLEGDQPQPQRAFGSGFRTSLSTTIPAWLPCLIPIPLVTCSGALTRLRWLDFPTVRCVPAMGSPPTCKRKITASFR